MDEPLNLTSDNGRKNVAVFVSHYRIDNSPSILNLLGYLTQSNCVTLFARKVVLGSSCLLDNLRVVAVDDDLHLAGTAMACTVRRVFLGRTFDRVICVDPHGFLICSVILPFVKPVYYSLELYVRDDHFGLHYPWWIRINERCGINSIRGLIIQSREKDEIFRNDYGLSPDIPTFLLPVTYDGPSSSAKSNHLRVKFNIDPGVRVALHLGGIAEWFSCLELAQTFARLGDWALIFHGYSSPEYLERLLELLDSNGIRNVHVNDELFAELEMVDEVIKSCDLGIAWYNDVSVGFRTAGHSSGKIPAYMRFGLPVLAKRYRSTHEAIEEPGAGLCVDAMAEIPDALARITREYELFSARARDTYDRRNNFRNYLAGLEQFIDTCHGDTGR